MEFRHTFRHNLDILSLWEILEILKNSPPAPLVRVPSCEISSTLALAVMQNRTERGPHRPAGDFWRRSVSNEIWISRDPEKSPIWWLGTWEHWYGSTIATYMCFLQAKCLSFPIDMLRSLNASGGSRDPLNPSANRHFVKDIEISSSWASRADLWNDDPTRFMRNSDGANGDVN